MRVKLFFLLVIVAACIAVNGRKCLGVDATDVSKEENGASLNDTLIWIKSQFDGQLDRWDHLSVEVRDESKCNLQIIRTFQLSTNGRVHTYKYIDLIPLRAIDPQNMEIDGGDGDNSNFAQVNAKCAHSGCIANENAPGWIIATLNTFEHQKSIRSQYFFDDNLKQDKNVDSVSLQGINEKGKEVAPRAKRAFQHAVSLCGGTSEPF